MPPYKHFARLYAMHSLIALTLAGMLTGTAYAQVSVSTDSLQHLVVAIQLRDVDDGNGQQGNLVEFDSILAWSIANTESAMVEIFESQIEDGAMQKIVGFPTRIVRNDGRAVLMTPVPRWSAVVVLLNDMVGFERQVNILTAWKEDADRLILDHVWSEPWVTGIGAAFLEEHAHFPDGSLLLVTRRIHEGVYHEVEFWRVQRDYSIAKLTSHSFFGSCRPGVTCDLTGYMLPEGFADSPVVHLLQTAPEYWGGVYDSVPVLDTVAAPRTVDLWIRAQDLDR